MLRQKEDPMDNVYGDRNLFCSCLPVSELA
jgi:hypothetical protein